MNFLDSLKTKIQDTISRIGANFSAGYKSATEEKSSTPIATQRTATLPVFEAIQKNIPNAISPEAGARFEQKIELAKKEEEAFNKPFASSVMSAIRDTYEGINKYGFEYPSRIVGGRIEGGLDKPVSEQFDISSISGLKKSIESKPTAFEAIKKVSEEKGLPAPAASLLGFIGEAIIPGPGELSGIAKVGKEAKIGSELLQEAKWSKLQKENPDLFNKGILRKSYKPIDAVGEIPKEIHELQGKWQNYGQYSEIPADKIYDKVDRYGYYVDSSGNTITDIKNGQPLISEKEWDDFAGKIEKTNVSNQQLRDELIKSFDTEQGKKYLGEVINALPKNSDGTINAYRIGTSGEEGIQSYTLSEGMAKTFSNQGTDILPAGTPGLPSKGYENFGELPVNIVKIDPKGIRAWSPYDAEILVEPRYVKSISANASDLTTSIQKAKASGAKKPKEEMLKRIELATEKAEKEFIADREKVIAKNKQPLIDQKPSFLAKIKEGLNPFKYQPEPIKNAWKKNVSDRLIANEKANEEFIRLADIPEKDSFRIVTDYQAGIQTPYTQRIKETFDSLFKEANARGLDVKYQENYVPQVYANTKEEVITALSKFMKDKGVPDDKVADYLQGIPLPREYSNALKLSPSFVKEKAFPNYQTAMEYGLTPRYSHPAQLAGHWRSEMEKSLANRELIETLKAERAIHTFKAPGEKAVDLPFSTEELYAEPKTAKALNDYFRDEDNIGIGAIVARAGAKASQRMQELVLSGGVPSTNVNFFTIGQGIKNLTAAEKSVIGTALRSNFDEATIGWFRANQPYITKMAEEGINMSGRLGNWDSVYSQLSSKTGLSRFFERSGEKFDDWFNKKTFKSFMPMQEVNIFKKTYDSAIEKGLSEVDARKLAGETTKAWSGTIEDWGRGKTLQDTINAIFFAPRFREGLINLFANTVKSLSTEISNPSFAINRKFILGAALTYGAYNALNKKLNGNYMWENEAGKEFDLKIPLKDGRYTYIAFLPSVAAFPRNMLSGTIALAKFDTATAGQKFGSLFSMPIKLVSEIATNKDYFGRPIWDEDSSTIKKLKDIAKYVGIDQYNHPFIQGAYNVIFAKDGKRKPWYEVVSRMAELPFKFNTQENIDKGKYYEAMDKQQAKREKELEPIREIYDRFQTMKANGQEEEAKKMYNELPDEAKRMYQSIKSSEKTKATNALKSRIFPVYEEIQDLKKRGKIDEATAIYRELSDDEKKAYQSLKKTFGTNE